jgi:GUN4-like
MVHRKFSLLGLLTIGTVSLLGLSGQAAHHSLFKPQIRYNLLEQQLKSGQWMAANAETARLVIAIARAQDQPVIGHDWLTTSAVAAFPCKAIKQIDSLWNTHSQGRYGFTSQLNLWPEGLDYGSLENRGDRWAALSQTLRWQEPAPVLDENARFPEPPRSSGALPKPIRSTADFDDQPMHSSYREFMGSAFLQRARQCQGQA